MIDHLFFLLVNKACIKSRKRNFNKEDYKSTTPLCSCHHSKCCLSIFECCINVDFSQQGITFPSKLKVSRPGIPPQFDWAEKLSSQARLNLFEVPCFCGSSNSRRDLKKIVINMLSIPLKRLLGKWSIQNHNNSSKFETSQLSKTHPHLLVNGRALTLWHSLARWK